MKISGKKVVKLEEYEKQKLREALEIIKDLLEEIDEQPIRYAKEDLEVLIFTEEWEVDF